MTFIDYLEQHYSKQTVDSYSRVVSNFLSNHPKAEKYSYLDVLDALHTLSSLNGRELAAIKQYYEYLTIVGARNDHPCKNLKIRRTAKYVQFQDLFSPNELELLLERECRYKELETRNKIIIGLLIYQGLTPENIVKLRVEDIDLDEGKVYVMATRQLNRRTLPLQAKQVGHMMKYIYTERPQKSQSKSKTLLFNKLGSRMTVDAINRLLRPLKHLFLDRNLNAQTIRQSVISNWLNVQNIGLEKCQEYAGHKWLSSTERYKREDMEEKKRMVGKYHPM